MADSQKHRPPISNGTIVVICIIMLVIGFIGGTRQRQILGVVGPIFGMKVETGELDTTSLQNVYQKLSENFDGKLDKSKLIAGANKGMVSAAGDKFTVYLDTQDAKELQSELTGEIGGGIGAEIGERDGNVIILRVLAGNPAQKSGLKNGDIIKSVDGKSAEKWDVQKVVDHLRGKVGTTVKIGIERDGNSKSFSVKRDDIKNPSVRSEIKNDVGILTISRFDDETGSLARKAAVKFKKAGVKGVILDLRGDGGGYLQAAPDVASLWLDNRLVVSQKTDGKTTNQLYSDGDATLKGLKTIVLVDGNTASASEIVTAALNDYDVATVMGEKTYGKGSVQSILDLNNGAQLKVTVAHWYPPKSPNVNGKGITPDVNIKRDTDAAKKGVDNQLDAAIDRLK